MYFESRGEAGALLAQQLIPMYRYEDCAVIALGDGSLVVAEEIASALHCFLSLLVIEDIEVPGEDLSFGGISQRGDFTYNSSFSSGEIDEYNSEYHGYLDEKKREAFQKINRLLGEGGIIDDDVLRNHIVILVADGVDEDSAIDVAIDYLKPIHTKKIIIATPIATVPAVDKLHMAADELHILDVKENFMGINHYYEDNTIPTHEQSIAKINEIVLNWR